MSDASQNTYDANYPGKQPAEAVEAGEDAVTYLDTMRSPVDGAWVAWAQDGAGDANGEPTYWYGETEIAAAEAARVGLGVAVVVYAPYPGMRAKLG